MPIISVEKGPLRGKRFKLPENGVIYVGREKRCQIQLMDTQASRVHCVLRGENGQWRIEDRQSRNGTFVNGMAVTRHDLKEGDLVEVGLTSFSYLESAEDPLLGRVMGGCRLEERIGRGGMGTVYRALQVSLERQVAVKVLAPSLAKDEAFVNRFVQEARASARLSHPNVVQVHDAGNEGAYYYMAMEYLPGGDLEQTLQKEGCVTRTRAVHIGLDALKALQFAEANEIVHRDVKPGNLLFAADGTTKMADLGIALDLKDPMQLLDAPVAGSPPYMAPEQARGEEIDHRADIYALGATLYHALSGCTPYGAGTPEQVLKRKLRGELVPLREQAPEVPARLAAVVMRMMAHNPADRYQSASEAEKALAAALHKPRKKKAAPPPFRRSRVQQLVPVGAILLAVIVALGIVLQQSPTPIREEEPSKTTSTETARNDAQRRRHGTQYTTDSHTDQDNQKKTSSTTTTSGKDHQSKKSDQQSRSPTEQKLVLRLQQLIQRGRLLEAADLLKQMPFGLRHSPVVAAQEEELEKRFSGLISVRSERIKTLCSEKSFAEARRELAELRAQLPADRSAMWEALELLIDRAEGEKPREIVQVDPDRPPPAEPKPQAPAEVTAAGLEAVLGEYQITKPLPVLAGSHVSGEVTVIPDQLEYGLLKLALDEVRKGRDWEATLKDCKKYVDDNRKKLEKKPIVQVSIVCDDKYGLFLQKKGSLRDRFPVKFGRRKAARKIVKASQEPRYDPWKLVVGTAPKPIQLWLLRGPLELTMEVSTAWKTKELTVQATGFFLSKRFIPPPPPTYSSSGGYITRPRPEPQPESYIPERKILQCTSTRNLPFSSEVARFFPNEREKVRENLPPALKELLAE